MRLLQRAMLKRSWIYPRQLSSTVVVITTTSSFGMACAHLLIPTDQRCVTSFTDMFLRHGTHGNNLNRASRCVLLEFKALVGAGSFTTSNSTESKPLHHSIRIPSLTHTHMLFLFSTLMFGSTLITLITVTLDPPT